MKKSILFFMLLAFFSIKGKAQTISDIEGNIYDTVHIGSQVWLKENLKTTTYNDGSKIPLVRDSIAWINLTSPGYCWYRNDSLSNKNNLGALYNWYTVNTSKLCPTGWHVPSNAEWHTLVLYLDPAAQDCYCTESTVAANKLKQAGTTLWANGNTGTNSSGFNAVGSGFRNYFDKNYEGRTTVTYFWTSTPFLPYTTVYHRWFSSDNGLIYEYYDKKIQGMSVRCIQDSPNDINENNKVIYNINLYPNPANDKVYIENIENQNLNLSIYNILGDAVILKKLEKGRNEIKINSLSNGVYMIEISGSKGAMKQKIIKE